MTQSSFKQHFFMTLSKIPTQPWTRSRSILARQSESEKHSKLDRIFEILDSDFESFFSIVDEVSDDKDLPKAERKRLQVLNAPNKSSRAKLVKLADKLYNLRDLDRVIPE